MTDQRSAPPPAALLGPNTAAPNARTVVAEVRSDAGLLFDPQIGPLLKSGGLILWQVDVSWTQAQQIQLWLTGAPAGGWGSFSTREAALKDFFDSFVGGTPSLHFLEYEGVFLTTGLPHARYTLVLSATAPTNREIYVATFNTALNNLLAGAASAAWAAELVNFLKMMLNQPSSSEDYLTLASNIGDLTSGGSPLIKAFLT